MSNKSFLRNHPFLSGFIVLSIFFMLLCGGIIFLIATFSQPSKSELFGHKAGVGVIELKGLIIRPEETLAALSAFRANSNVRAIVVRIDSPGGAVGASQEVFEELRRTNKVKPVVASLGSVAASGGYYAALGAEKIVANPGTLTGSLGVVLRFANLEELFDKIGYRTEVVKSGDLKDIGSSGRALSKKEREVLQVMIDNVHSQFVRAVIENRQLPAEKVKKIADGRIFSGEQAKTFGLVDYLGNFTDAILLAAELGNLGTEMPHLIYPRKNDFSLLNFLIGEKTRTLLDHSLSNTPVISYEWILN